MNILLTNIRLSLMAGTETFTRDLALALRRAGHAPQVYTPRPGAVAEVLRAEGVPVVTALGDIATPPDVIHGNQHAELVAAIVRFPNTPAVFTCHGPSDWVDHPPALRRIAAYVAIDELRRARLLGSPGVSPDEIVIIGNGIDTCRFASRPAPLPPRPRAALLVSNHATPENFGGALTRVCREIGLPMEVVGSGVGRPALDLPARLRDVDLVFGVGRAAMEAMATGAACILCDRDGLGPMVTPDNVDDLRERNFGRALARGPITSEALRLRLLSYDPADARDVQHRIRACASADAMAGAYVDVYRRAMARQCDLPDLAEDIHRYLGALFAAFLPLLPREASVTPRG